MHTAQAMTEIEFTAQFKVALKKLSEGKEHIFITGKAGTGKSTLLRYYSEQQETEPIILAPTGIAALNVGGQTIHRFFRFRPDTDITTINRSKIPNNQARIYRALKEIIIDEISMVRADLLDCIDAFLRLYGPLRDWPFGGVRLVMFGDLYQLPPVVKHGDREFIYGRYGVPYFYAAHSLRDEKLQVIELDKIFRQTDTKFIELLNGIRTNSISDKQLAVLNSRCEALPPANKTPANQIVVTATNARAQKINADYLQQIKEPICRSEATIEGEFRTSEYPNDKTLVFKRGARIMMLNNDQQNRWVNGSMATIIEIEKVDGEQEVLVQITESGEYANVAHHRWSSFRYTLSDNAYEIEEIGGFFQFPFRLAWAITIHKSQGKTFPRVHIDLGNRAFAAGQTYVALSRCRTLNDISLQRSIIRDDVYVDRSLVDFFKRIEQDALVATPKTERQNSDDIIKTLQDAIDTQKKMRIKYIHLNGHIGYRTITAYKMSTKQYQSRTYTALEAQCAEKKKQCIFDTGNILDIHILTE